MAIGANSNDGNGSNSGHVRIFEDIESSWVQVHQDIDGEAPGDKSGSSVSFSGDGKRVAIGAPSNDGSGSSSGHVRVFEDSGLNWIQIHDDLDGMEANDNFGNSVSLSFDGTRVAVGAPFHDGFKGSVLIYQDSGSTWVRVHQEIDGEESDDQSGYSVSLSADGNRVAIGAYHNDGIGNNAGHVRLYEDNGTSWAQIHQDIEGEATGDLFGLSVSLSADGTRVAIGAPFNDGNGNTAGHVQIFKDNGTHWDQIYQDIDGEFSHDRSGWSVSLSGSGTRVAIGAPYNDGEEILDEGVVRIFQDVSRVFMSFKYVRSNICA